MYEPRQPSGHARTPSRPAALPTFGVLNLLVGVGLLLYHGGIGLCCLGPFALFEFAGRAQGMGRIGEDIMNQVEAFIPGVSAYLVASLFAWSILGIWLMVTGIGLFGARRWARLGNLIAAGLLLVVSIASLIYVIAVYQPGWVEFMDDMEKKAPQQERHQQGPNPAKAYPIVATVPVVGLTMLYALLLGLFMLLPRVRDACQPAEAAKKEKSFFEEDHH